MYHLKKLCTTYYYLCTKFVPQYQNIGWNRGSFSPFFVVQYDTFLIAVFQSYLHNFKQKNANLYQYILAIEINISFYIRYLQNIFHLELDRYRHKERVTTLFRWWPSSDPLGIRTQDPQLRRLLLYPAELPNQTLFELECKDR